MYGRKFRKMLCVCAVEVAMQLFDDSCGHQFSSLASSFLQIHLRPIGIIAALLYCLKIAKRYKYSNLAERLYRTMYTNCLPMMQYSPVYAELDMHTYIHTHIGSYSLICQLMNTRNTRSKLEHWQQGTLFPNLYLTQQSN